MNTAYESGLSFRRYREIGKDSDILTLNASLLKEPTSLHAKHKMDDADGTSDALSIGDALHKAVLEPEAYDNDFDKHYMMSPTKGLATKKAIEMRALYPDHILLNEDMIEQVERMRDAIYRHKLAAKLLETCTERELTGVAADPDMGVVRKIRIDACQGTGEAGQMWSPYLIDIKTTRDILGFAYQVRKFAYDVQAAFYLDTDAMITGKRRENFIFICVTNTAPYCARIYALPPTLIEKARDIYMRRMGAIVTASANHQWEAWENEMEPVLIAD